MVVKGFNFPNISLQNLPYYLSHSLSRFFDYPRTRKMRLSVRGANSLCLFIIIHFNSIFQFHSYSTSTGTKGESGVRQLKDIEDHELKRGSSLEFIMSHDSDLGDLLYLRIWIDNAGGDWYLSCLLYTSPSPRDKRQSRMPSSA